MLIASSGWPSTVVAALRVTVTRSSSPAFRVLLSAPMAELIATAVTCGPSASTITLRLACVAAVPARLLTSARTDLVPSAPKLLPATLACQLPSACTVAVALPVAKVMVTTRPASTLVVVPLMTTWPAASLPTTLSSLATEVMATTAGSVLTFNSPKLMSDLATPPTVTVTATL